MLAIARSGGDGNDTLNLTYSGPSGVSLTQVADAGLGDDFISLSSSGVSIAYTVDGNDGNDRPNINVKTSTVTAALGMGDDVVTYSPSVNNTPENNTIDINFGEGTNSFGGDFRFNVIRNSDIHLTFGSGNDLVGSTGSNVRASGGTFSVDLGEGNNTALISGNTVDVVAGSGADTLQVAGATITVEAGGGNDTVNVSGAGSASAGDGNDTITASGTLSLIAGDGDDVAHLSLQGGGPSLTLGTGTDKVFIDFSGWSEYCHDH